MIARHGNSAAGALIHHDMGEELLALTATPGMVDITVLLGAMLAVYELAGFAMRWRR